MKLEIRELWATAKDNMYINIGRSEEEAKEFFKQDVESEGADSILKGFGVYSKVTNLVLDDAEDFHYKYEDALKELNAYKLQFKLDDIHRNNQSIEEAQNEGKIELITDINSDTGRIVSGLSDVELATLHRQFKEQKTILNSEGESVLENEWFIFLKGDSIEGIEEWFDLTKIKRRAREEFFLKRLQKN